MTPAARQATSTPPPGCAAACCSRASRPTARARWRRPAPAPLLVKLGCHGEERSDEAISIHGVHVGGRLLRFARNDTSGDDRQMANNPSRVAHADLIRFIAAAYGAAGVPEADAAKAAELMAASDISGADGHGVFRLPQYIRRIKAGGLNVRPEITVIRQAKATPLVDGDNGLRSLVVARPA